MSAERPPDEIGLSPEEVQLQPLYARVLRLRYLNPGGVLCFFFFEGAIALGGLLALAELVSWWAMLVLPATVGVMVKINDVVAGAVARSAAQVPEREQERFRRQVAPVVGRASVPAPVMGEHVRQRTADRMDQPETPGQRSRQSASRGSE